VQTALNLGLLLWDELQLIKVQAALNLYYDLEVLSPTRCKNRGKVRLVGKNGKLFRKPVRISLKMPADVPFRLKGAL
jgi:hypothetical protein